jgi:hypothetical protein
MYSLRTEPFRRATFDRVCTTFVKGMFSYASNASYTTIRPLDVNLTTLLIDYLDFAIETQNDNTALQDKALDTTIISVK